MVQILINPEPLKSEIKSLKSAKDGITAKLTIDTDGLDLQTIQKLKEIEADFNKIIEAYKGLLEQDIKNMDIIIAEWMKVDAKYAGKDFIGRLTGEK